MAVASPVLCYLLEAGLKSSYGFSFGLPCCPSMGYHIFGALAVDEKTVIYGALLTAL